MYGALPMRAHPHMCMFSPCPHVQQMRKCRQRCGGSETAVHRTAADPTHRWRLRTCGEGAGELPGGIGSLHCAPFLPFLPSPVDSKNRLNCLFPTKMTDSRLGLERPKLAQIFEIAPILFMPHLYQVTNENKKTQAR